MTTIGMSAPPGSLPASLTLKGLADVIRNDARVAITAIVAGAAVVLALFATVVVLVLNGGETATLLSLVSTLLAAGGGWAALSARAEAKKAAENSNGMTSRVVEHALSRDGPPA